MPDEQQKSNERRKRIRDSSGKKSKEAKMGVLEKFREYNKILSIDSIARRYIAMNGFDGVLAILGILISSFFAGVSDARLIIGVSLGAAVAMAVSGVWGAYMAEAAERKKELKDLEGTMLTKLKKTKIGRAGEFASWIIALIDGAAPFITATMTIVPFFILPITAAYYTAFAIAFAILFFLGMFLGRISKENLMLSGVKMVFAGIVIIAIIMLLGIKTV